MKTNGTTPQQYKKSRSTTPFWVVLGPLGDLFDPRGPKKGTQESPKASPDDAKVSVSLKRNYDFQGNNVLRKSDFN